MIKIIADNKEIETGEGMCLLTILLENGIYVPNLCYLGTMNKPPVSCRLCFVEIEGYDEPVSSCVITAEDGMIIRTDTPEVRRLQKTAFEFLLSMHNVDCGNCVANKRCELQEIAKFLHVPLKQKRLDQLKIKGKLNEDHPYLVYDQSKCVLCGKCEYTCRMKYKSPYLSFAGRGLDTYISFFGETDAERIPCDECYACVGVCPVGALVKKTD